MTENLQGDGILEGMRDVITFPGVTVGPDNKLPATLPEIEAMLALLMKQKEIIDLVYQLAIIKIKIAMLLADLKVEPAAKDDGQKWPP